MGTTVSLVAEPCSIIPSYQIVVDEQALPEGGNGAGATQRLFSVKYLFGEAKLPRIFYSLRKAKTSR